MEFPSYFHWINQLNQSNDLFAVSRTTRKKKARARECLMMRCLFSYQSGVFYSRSINIDFSSSSLLLLLLLLFIHSISFRTGESRFDSQLRYCCILTMFALNDNKPIWVRDNEHGFLLGKITDIGSDAYTIQLSDQRKVNENVVKIKHQISFFLDY